MSEYVDFGDLPHRAIYRVRPVEEVEDAMVKIDGCMQTRQVRLRSIRSVQDAVITFRNMTDHDVRVVWLDFDGNEVVYSVIEPREMRRYRTFTSHPWIVRSVEGQMRMMINDSQAIFGASEEQIAEIRVPPLLTWTTSTHKFFPKSFRDAVRCVLLCHHRSRFGDPPSCSSSLDDKEESQSISLVRMGMMFLTRNPASCRQRSLKYKRDGETSSRESNCKQSGLSFGDLPRELVQLIIKKMEAPEIVQDLSNGAEAAPDVKPVWLPEDVDLEKFLPPEEVRPNPEEE